MSQINRSGTAPSQSQTPEARHSAHSTTGPRHGASTPRAQTPADRGAPGRAQRTGGGSWKRDIIILAVSGLIVAVLALVLQIHWPNGFPVHKSTGNSASAVSIAEIRTDGAIRINEIMSANRGTLAGDDGSTPDWVEVANQSERPVDIGGYSLAKTDSGAGVFTFPSMTLEPQACTLIYADSRLRAEAGEALHAPFRLSSAGDTLMLFNPSGTAVDTVNIPALNADTAYVRTSRDEWMVSADVTPGLPNTQQSVLLLNEPAGAGDVVLNELVASNGSALTDENGEYYDYIELYNRSGQTVDITGWYLSDDAAQPRKWRIPAVSVEPGGYLVIHASGLNRLDDPEHLHTNFSLSSEGEQLVLSDARGQVLERIEFGLLKSDQAWARAADDTWHGTAPSPGAANG